MTRYRNSLLLISALALVGAVGYGLMHRPSPLVLNVWPSQATPLPTSVPTAAAVRCHVVGPVAVPGVYTLLPGSLVEDAIRAAGGPTTDADLDRLNLAEEIQDQVQIVVPTRTEARAANSPNVPVKPGGDLIKVNSCDANLLQTLPGIGPVLAGRIIDYRDENGPFDTVDDLIEVKGIGEATLEKLRPLITVGR